MDFETLISSFGVLTINNAIYDGIGIKHEQNSKSKSKNNYLWHEMTNCSGTLIETDRIDLI